MHIVAITRLASGYMYIIIEVTPGHALILLFRPLD
jgi:hypothetical protein